MKTSTWSPVHSESSSLAIDAPTLMWGNGTGPVGPLPLLLCMFKATQLARYGQDFMLQSELGTVLVAIEQGQLRGEDVPVELFVRMQKLAIAFYDDMLEQVVSDAQTELQRTKNT